MSKVSMALAAVFLSCPLAVLADTIDFEGSDPVASGEFTISGESSGIYAIGDFGLFATTVFGWCAQDCTSGGGAVEASKTKAGPWSNQFSAGKSSHPQVITLNRADDAPFSLNQLDAAPLFNADDDNPLVVTGFLDGGGTVTQNLTLSDVPNELQTYTLSGFTDVVRVEFTKLDTAPDLQDAAIDNLVVNEGSPGVSLTPDPLDFGDQAVGSTSGAQVVTLENTGNADLDVSAIDAPSAPFARSGGSCASTPFTLVAGDTCTLEYTFSPSSTGASSDTISVTSNADSSPDSFDLTGNGIQAAVGLSSTTVDFGIVDLTTDGSSSTVTVTNTGTAPLEITGLSGLEEPFSVSGGTCQPLPATLAVDESCTIEITFAPDRQVRASDTLQIESNAGSSPDSVVVLAESSFTAAIPALDWRGMLLMMLAMMGGVVVARRQLG